MAGVVFNTKNFDDRLMKTETALLHSAKKIRHDVANDILLEATDRVPLKDGTLRSSGHTEDFTNESIVAYGGMASQYAIYQHEGMRSDGSHVVQNYTTPGTGRKFLENAIIENLPKYQRMYGLVLVEMNV